MKDKYKDRDNGNLILILLDIKLPKIDGKDVLKAVKEMRNLKYSGRNANLLTRRVDIMDSYDLGVNA
jgi:DNA-binding response OmpR family regulator